MVIAGYPGVGKTYYAKDKADVLDMEPAPYSGFPDYAGRFVNDLSVVLPRYRHVFIPTDLKVLNELSQRGIRFVIVIPDPAETEPYDEYGFSRLLKALSSDPSSDKALLELMERYYRILLLKSGEHLSDLMEVIDRKLEKVTVDKAFPARLVSAVHSDGTPYEDNDWRQAFIGKVGTVALLSGLCYGRRKVAFFYTDDRIRMTTSPGLVEYGQDSVTIRSHSVYTWETVGPELAPEKNREIAEAYIFLR